MKKKRIRNSILVVICIFTFCYLSAAQRPTSLKTEALVFSLNIMETIFAGDCDQFKSMFDDELFGMDDEIIAFAEVEGEICELLEVIISDSTKTYQHYLTDYHPQVFTPDEFKEKFKEVTFPDFYLPKAEDFFFITKQLQDEDGDDYLEDELEVLLVRKLEKGWVIKGGY
ncbi:MAG: hypothetical protein AAF573_21500 [Bacteroidota bacterium]